jgi:hypothetical protein
MSGIRSWTVVHSSLGLVVTMQKLSTNALVAPPFLPEATKGEGLRVAQADVDGLLALGPLLPLIEAIGQHEAAALLIQVAKGWLGG